jgi:hypothetical protein
MQLVFAKCFSIPLSVAAILRGIRDASLCSALYCSTLLELLLKRFKAILVTLYHHASLYIALYRSASLCIALHRFVSLRIALFRFASLCIALHHSASLYIVLHRL